MFLLGRWEIDEEVGRGEETHIFINQGWEGVFMLEEGHFFQKKSSSVLFFLTWLLFREDSSTLNTSVTRESVWATLSA